MSESAESRAERVWKPCYCSEMPDEDVKCVTCQITAEIRAAEEAEREACAEIARDADDLSTMEWCKRHGQDETSSLHVMLRGARKGIVIARAIRTRGEQ